MSDLRFSVSLRSTSSQNLYIKKQKVVDIMSFSSSFFTPIYNSFDLGIIELYRPCLNSRRACHVGVGVDLTTVLDDSMCQLYTHLVGVKGVKERNGLNSGSCMWCGKQCVWCGNQWFQGNSDGGIITSLGRQEIRKVCRSRDKSVMRIVSGFTRGSRVGVKGQKHYVSSVSLEKS